MADPILLVQGDTGPQIKATITRSDTGAVVDLTDATVQLHFRRKDIDDLLFSITDTAAGTDPVNGIAIFLFSGTQLDIESGDYQGEVEVVFNGGTRETIYEIIDFSLREDFA
tara:strand:+ start:2029 stop:2364 length:336 start_codon:yes stop_codon:yes gene_type:complete